MVAFHWSMVGSRCTVGRAPALRRTVDAIDRQLAAGRNCTEDGRKVKYRWSLVKGEDRAAIVGRRGIKVGIRKILAREHRKILGDHVPEVGTKHSDVEATAITHTNNRLRIELISNTQTRGKRLVRVCDIAVRANPTIASHVDDALIQVSKTAVALGVDGFGEVNFPTQAVSERKFGADAPGILAIEEPPLLPLGGTQTHANVALERSDIPEKECGQRQAIGTGVGSTDQHRTATVRCGSDR